MKKAEQHTTSRPEEIAQRYLQFLDRHLEDLVQGRVTEMLQLRQIAAALYISHYHLTDTVKQLLGHHPCHFYDQKIISKAKEMLAGTSLPVADIALTLTYDPSNFSKFFKKFTGQTPGDYRKAQQAY
ncbi:helix-turn-helix domain-containing protein [Chitinophaga alhagiae]|uniref:helix-turn-helix domain-containing protein n=1 Tax=Chitinophaga alhagiae TaxID=2203219 RepID=UPI000E5B559F|nr:AraC family transcriptional regulator [Chitinophaga alhagiae]